MFVLRTATALALAPVVALLVSLAPSPAAAHCDTADGPVVVEARLALEKGDVTPLLKWVKADAEGEIRAAFARARALRTGSPEVKALADDWFLENLVRIHRAGEGAPYTGIRPAGTPIDPAVRLADKALESGEVDGLVSPLMAHATAEVKERFEKAREARAHAAESVAKGREFVAAYIELTHFVERLHVSITTNAAHAAPSGGGAAAHAH